MDRLGWAAGIGFESYGLRIGIRVSEASALPPVLERLPPGWRLSASPLVRQLYSLRLGGATRAPGLRRFNLLYGGATRLARSMVLGEVLDVLESDLRIYVAAAAPRRLFLHAGVVGWRGRAILIPGRSHSGKSRLVEALVRAGAAYYSDEYAVLDGRGRVHPYPSPLTRRGEGGEPPRRLTARELGGAAGEEPLAVGLVVISQYRRGRRWRPRRLTPGRGALALLDHAVPARRRPARTLALLGRLASRAPVLSSPRGEAVETAALLLARLGSTL